MTRRFGPVTLFATSMAVLGVIGALVATSLDDAPGAPAAASAARAEPAARPAAHPAGGSCLGDEADLTVEERRLGDPLPGDDVPAATRFVEAAGFENQVARFTKDLCAAEDLKDATKLARGAGARLWTTAVDRAQGRTESGSIDRYDDRPLYWARLSMSRAIREWQPDHEVSVVQRNALARVFGYASRGIDSVEFPRKSRAKRLLVSGFDTYGLSDSLRNSNPSGASALQLDGRRVTTEHGVVAVQAVMLPVNWSDFDQGIVEDAFGPWLTEPRARVDGIMTLSQTGRGVMNIEKWAGANRGGSPDNNDAIHFGPISAAARWPQPQPSPQWIRTTLPWRQMIAANTGPWPVTLNDGVCEWPRDTYPEPDAVRCRDDPSRGSTAASAPGGSYLSNESMYRSNRLRLGAGLTTLPGGHLHISSLVYPDDEGSITSPEFEADRQAVIDQTVALVDAAARALA